MRGDPPEKSTKLLPGPRSTPHARGSTPPPSGMASVVIVYPACAGIHLLACIEEPWALGLPRMRGDPPYPAVNMEYNHKSTPHARGSTLH